VRDDFINNATLPKHETLGDLEIGYSLMRSEYNLGANFYFMDYRNQLVLTGALNDVGGSIRTNVDKSYRSGLELTAGVLLASKLKWSGNFTYSENKIKSFTEDLNDYEDGTTVSTTYSDTDISYSPNIVGASQFTYTPVSGLDITFFSKFVGKQYLDNTTNEDRTLDPYFVNDLILNYSFTTKFIKEIGLSFMINNLFNEVYESNGYSFGYIYGEEYREVYYYAQAGINFLAGLKLRF
jgi:iron complex outermembrane receptor protein